MSIFRRHRQDQGHELVEIALPRWNQFMLIRPETTKADFGLGMSWALAVSGPPPEQIESTWRQAEPYARALLPLVARTEDAPSDVDSLSADFAQGWMVAQIEAGLGLPDPSLSTGAGLFALSMLNHGDDRSFCQRKVLEAGYFALKFGLSPTELARRVTDGAQLA